MRKTQRTILLLLLVTIMLLLPMLSFAESQPPPEEEAGDGQDQTVTDPNEDKEENKPSDPNTVIVRVAPNGAIGEQNGAYLMRASEDGKIRFTASADKAVSAYLYSVADAGGTVVASGSVADGVITLAADSVQNGAYTLKVEAIVEDEIKVGASLRFRLANAQETQKADTPTGSQQGRRYGGFGGYRGFSANGSSAEQEETIKAGKALTSTHAAGDYSLVPHDGVALNLENGETKTLQLGGQTLAFSLNDGETGFFAEINEEILRIVPAAETEQLRWSVSLQALETLNHSQINMLQIVSDTQCISLPTKVSLQGYYYGKLRSQGYVSKDMLLTGCGNTKQLVVDGDTFLMNRGILEPTEAKEEGQE